MDKVLWVKFGWSDHYRGESVDGNFSQLARGDVGHEAYNFEPAADGTYYCYVPELAGRHAPRNPDHPTGWTVVCLAKHPKRTGIHIVGWYEDATLVGEWSNVPETRAHLPLSASDSDAHWLYCITSRTAYFVPPEMRTMPFSHRSVGQATFSFLRGPGVRATDNKKKANKKEVLKYLKDRMRRLKSAAIKNPTNETAPDPGAEPGDPLRGFGTPEHRKKVEKAAEKAVKSHYRAKGFSCTDVTKKNLGFDFIFRKRRTERHVEVKGTSGDLPRFFMTRNENAYRENPKWRFAIVTNALSSKPKVRVYNSQKFEKTFELDPYVYTGTPVIMPKRL